MAQQPSGASLTQNVPLNATLLKGLIDHELRTPLQTLLLFVHLAEAQFGEHDRSLVDGARRALDELCTIHEDMRSLLTRSGGVNASSDLTAQGLVRWIHTTCEPLATTRGITLTGFDNAPEGVTIEHGRVVRYVILNLVRNAVNHGPPGGTVHLRWTSSTSQQHIRIRDDGAGLRQLAPGTLDNTNLERLYRSSDVHGSFEGRSRGLMLAVQLADYLGGHLTYERAPGEGCAFTLTLPTPNVSNMHNVS